MRRSLALRIGTLVLVVFTTAGPVLAAPHDDSPIGPIRRVVERVIKQVTKILRPSPNADSLVTPKP